MLPCHPGPHSHTQRLEGENLAVFPEQNNKLPLIPKERIDPGKQQRCGWKPYRPRPRARPLLTLCRTVSRLCYQQGGDKLQRPGPWIPCSGEKGAPLTRKSAAAKRGAESGNLVFSALSLAAVCRGQVTTLLGALGFPSTSNPDLFPRHLRLVMRACKSLSLGIRFPVSQQPRDPY